MTRIGHCIGMTDRPIAAYDVSSSERKFYSDSGVMQSAPFRT